MVHRSDGSGTTFNFTDYLYKVSPTWKSKVGEGTTVNWPADIGGKGNEGVWTYVKQTPNSIGYVVQPDAASFQAAAATATWSPAKNFNLPMTNAPGAKAWPITATSWVTIVKQPKNAANSRVTLDFSKWAYAHSDQQAAALDYVPLPDSLVKQIEGYWKAEFKQ